MSEITTIGLDLAKSVFQVHGVDASGETVLRRQLRRRQLIPFFKKLPSCLIGVEACATSHHWARELQSLGHEVRIMPANYVKPYLKWNKNDAADAEAICEAVTRPSMRFVAVKSADQQSLMILHRTRSLLIRQRTMLVNAIRAHFAKFGIVAAARPARLLASPAATTGTEPGPRSGSGARGPLHVPLALRPLTEHETRTPARASTFIRDASNRTASQFRRIATIRPRCRRDRSIERGCSGSGEQENGNGYHNLGANRRSCRRLRHTRSRPRHQAHARSGLRRLRQKAYWRALISHSESAASVADNRIRPPIRGMGEARRACLVVEDL